MCDNPVEFLLLTPMGSSCICASGRDVITFTADFYFMTCSLKSLILLIHFTDT